MGRQLIDRRLLLAALIAASAYAAGGTRAIQAPPRFRHRLMLTVSFCPPGLLLLMCIPRWCLPMRSKAPCRYATGGPGGSTAARAGMMANAIIWRYAILIQMGGQAAVRLPGEGDLILGLLERGAH